MLCFNRFADFTVPNGNVPMGRSGHFPTNDCVVLHSLIYL